MKMTVSAWFTCLVCIVAPATAQTGGALAQRLDSIAGAGVREDRAVGIVAAVAQRQDTLLLEAYGQSDVARDVPMTVDTIIPIGSTTKQFTAAAILKLQDQGRLDVDDDITTWLPDFETAGAVVTLRHLLAHTSGVVDGGEIAELRAIQLLTNLTATRDDVYEVIRRQPLQFPTGTTQRYSNTNFWLLGRVVERVSGMSYEDYIEQALFEPLGMTRSRYCDSPYRMPGGAFGYGLRNGNVLRGPDVVHTVTFASGSICSTAEDMVTWLRALHGGRVLSPQSYTEMITPARLDDGTALLYSMGLSVGEDAYGHRYIGHNGGGFGFSSEARWYPERELAVVVLTNSEPDAITQTTIDLAAAVLPAALPAGSFADDASLLAGTYRGPGRGQDMVIEVTATPDGLAFAFDGAPAVPLPWVEGRAFRRGDGLLTFRGLTADGSPAELRVDTVGDYFVLAREQ